MEIDARRITTEGILAGYSGDFSKIEQSDKERLVRLSDDLNVPLISLMNWNKFGFDSLAAVISGILLKLLLCGVGGLRAEEGKNFAQAAISMYLRPSIDGTVSASFEYARNAAVSQAIQVKNDFDSSLNKWWLLFFEESTRLGHGPDHVPDTRQFQLLGNASGSIEVGVEVNFSTDINLQGPWYPGSKDQSDAKSFFSPTCKTSATA